MSNIATTNQAKTDKQRSRRRHARIAVAIAAPAALTAGLLAGTASSASAVVTAQLNPGQVYVYPTWGWGGLTKLCVYNYSSAPANVRINVPTGAGENVQTGPYGSKCITRSWWGAPLLVQNWGAGAVRVTTT